jgi:hypothetical protein
MVVKGVCFFARFVGEFDDEIAFHCFMEEFSEKHL